MERRQQKTESVSFEAGFLSLAFAASFLAVIFTIQGDFWLTGVALVFVVITLLAACSIEEEKGKTL